MADVTWANIRTWARRTALNDPADTSKDAEFDARRVVALGEWADTYPCAGVEGADLETDLEVAIYEQAAGLVVYAAYADNPSNQGISGDEVAVVIGPVTEKTKGGTAATRTPDQARTEAHRLMSRLPCVRAAAAARAAAHPSGFSTSSRRRAICDGTYRPRRCGGF